MRISPETLAQGRFVRLVKHGHWEYADRVNATGAVVIVAVTADRKLLLVEQFRIPLQRDVIELPAGLAGDTAGEPGDDIIGSARRELLEETGYEADSLEIATFGPTSAGLTTEVVHIVVANDLRKTADGGGIEHEEIVVHEVPLTEVGTWVARQIAAGKLVDPKVFAGLYFAAYH